MSNSFVDFGALYDAQCAMMQAQNASQYQNALLSGLGHTHNSIYGALGQSNIGASPQPKPTPKATAEAESVLWLRRRVDEICWKG